MTRVVLDTNVLVSALLKPGSIPETVFKMILDHPRIRLCLSKDIVHEYTTVLSYGKFKKYLKTDDVTEALRVIAHAAVIVDPRSTDIPKLADPDDTKFLACARTARATYLITGNTKHFPQHFSPTAIVTPRAFYDALFTALSFVA